MILTAGAGRRSRRKGKKRFGPGVAPGGGLGPRGWRKGLGVAATSHQTDPLTSLGLKKRVSQGPGISGNGPEGATSLHPGGEEAGRSGSAGAGLRGGGGRQGTAEPSPERDANRQTWKKSLRVRELSMLPPRAEPACTQPGEGATGRRRWPPEGVWDRTGCT
ncbi:translation initiation factor IF-2-like [Phocoena sinus]|uniref:translation initiation factor IF-2-like n=1 Tax=Phocoena sinus TaxID=42100 RepID=UPI0013C4917F|nr:translation initiation factor IF-2-like [Phocoena sinus]